MPVLAENEIRLFTYVNDDGEQFNVSITREKADVGSFGAGSSTQPGLPRKHRMRLIHGATAAGRRVSIPMSSLGAAFSLLSSGAFSWDGDSFTITGYTGEQFSLGRLP